MRLAASKDDNRDGELAQVIEKSLELSKVAEETTILDSYVLNSTGLDTTYKLPGKGTLILDVQNENEKEAITEFQLLKMEKGSERSLRPRQRGAQKILNLLAQTGTNEEGSFTIESASKSKASTIIVITDSCEVRICAKLLRRSPNIVLKIRFSADLPAMTRSLSSHLERLSKKVLDLEKTVQIQECTIARQKKKIENYSSDSRKLSSRILDLFVRNLSMIQELKQVKQAKLQQDGEIKKLRTVNAALRTRLEARDKDILRAQDDKTFEKTCTTELRRLSLELTLATLTRKETTRVRDEENHQRAQKDGLGKVRSRPTEEDEAGSRRRFSVTKTEEENNDKSRLAEDDDRSHEWCLFEDEESSGSESEAENRTGRRQTDDPYADLRYIF